MNAYQEEEYFVIPEDFGYISEDELPNFDETQQFLSGIQEALYKTGDVETLEHCLEELCAQFKTPFNPGDMKFASQKTRDLQQWFLGYQAASRDEHTGRTIADYEQYVK